jgi:hypothetical protein
MPSSTTYKSLLDVLESYPNRNNYYGPNSLFLAWFLDAYLLNNSDDSLAALTGGTGDKNVDALWIDYKSKNIYILQGKLRESSSKNENRNDVLNFVRQLSELFSSSDIERRAFFNDLNASVKDSLSKAVTLFANDPSYKLTVFFISTGSISRTILSEVEQELQKYPNRYKAELFDCNRIASLLKDYNDSVIPHVPDIVLSISGNAQSNHIDYSYITSNPDNSQRQLKSWVFTAKGAEIAKIYHDIGNRIFARNIRGYQGATKINTSIQHTMKEEPEYFWYFNNGITIVCNDATILKNGMKSNINIKGAQIINGLQTTRSLSDIHGEVGGDIDVLVKVIKIPYDNNEEHSYDNLVNNVVRSTNWQNPISMQDLVSNTAVQIMLEKELRKRDYQYIRKRMSKTEARTGYGAQVMQIKKDELALAVAATIYDPAIPNTVGKERLFEEDYYDNIFRSDDVNYYLIRYWIMALVKSAVRGNNEYKHGKWFVMRHVWEKLGSETEIVQICEEGAKDEKEIIKEYIVAVAKKTIMFYRSVNKQLGQDEKIEMAPFFKRKNNLASFRKYMEKSSTKTITGKYDRAKNAIKGYRKTMS